ncbi:MAG: DUF3102 domain-containing protein [Planctomycetaceae bacterium]|nr:DUF3102 domain-containing protein [Planctomycetaceae bacterium]
MTSLSKRTSDDQGGLSLTGLAERINQTHAECESAIRGALDRAILCGESLIAAKAAVAHGQWLPWLAANCPALPERTVQAYMRIAKNAPKLKSATIAHLGVGDALKLLAEPRDEARLADDPFAVLKEAERVIGGALEKLDAMKARTLAWRDCEPTVETVEAINECIVMVGRAKALGGTIEEWQARGQVALGQALREFISKGLLPEASSRWPAGKLAEYLDLLIPVIDQRIIELEAA